LHFFSSWLASNIFISGIPDALKTYRQFITPVYAVFGRNDRDLSIPAGDTKEIIAVTLSQERTHQLYLTD
jgi:hypothetical protein